jgi:phosphate transport system substrate-binding protein
MSGSNTVGGKLAPDLAEAWLLDMGATNIETVQRKDSQGNNIPERVVSGEKNGKLIGVEIKAHGTNTGVDALRNGEADVWMASAPVTKEQAERLSALGDMRSKGSEHVVGLDGIAIIVSGANHVDSLTKAQVKAIFTGQIRDWSDLRQPAASINLYARDANSGTRVTFQDLVLGPGNRMAPLAPKKPEGYDDGDRLSDDVVADPHGIGFVGMTSIRSAKAVTIKDGSATALAPTTYTVRNENYPFTGGCTFIRRNSQMRTWGNLSNSRSEGLGRSLWRNRKSRPA